MVVWKSASSQHGELCAVMSGMAMMPELCVDNLDMTLKVCMYAHVYVRLCCKPVIA